MALTKARRARLEKLAAYLESLPKSYRHFDMAYFVRAHDNIGADVVNEAMAKYALENGGVTTCGTAACAAGHGPAAGILVPRRMVTTTGWGAPRVEWDEYCTLFVGYDVSISNDWCFGGMWAPYDNHHWGAAARIRYLLALGKPPKGYEVPARRWREAYEPYRRDSRSKPARAETRSGSVHESGGAGTAIAQTTPSGPAS